MPRDSQTKLSKKEQMKQSKREEKDRRRKKDETSDSEDDSDYNPDESEEEIDIHEYRKFLSKIFPSKHLDKKIADGEKDIKRKTHNKKNNKKDETETESEEDDDSWETESEEEVVKSSKKRKNRRIIEESETDEDEEVTLGSEDTEDEEEEDEEEQDEGNPTGGKLNIILTIGGPRDGEDEWTDEDGDETYDENDIDSDEETEDEDASVSSVSTIGDNDKKRRSSKNKKISKEDKKSAELLAQVKSEINEEKNDSDENNKVTQSENEDVLSKLKELQSANKNNKTIKKCIEMYEEEIKKQKEKAVKKEKKYKDKNLRIFRKIVKDKNTTNDFAFYEKLDIPTQKRLIKELREINKVTRIEKPYRMTLLESEIPVQFKAAAMKKINSLRHMDPGSGEYYKIKNWVDTFMKIPFGKNEGLPISIEDGVDKCHDFMANAQKTLDNAVYGLNDAKMQIMQMLGQLLTNPKAIGTAIAIHGPPGTGKCHTYDTPILMYDGSIKMVQDIKVGDVVMGDDSTPRNVLSLGRGEDELYEIIPTKGEKYGVNSEHILCLKTSGINRIRKYKNADGSISHKAEYFNKNTYKVQSKRFANLNDSQKFLEKITSDEDEIIHISVKDYLNLPINIQKNLKGYKTGVEFEERVVPFDPYIIGVWLGDGTSSNPGITNQEAVILHYIKNEIKQHNLQLSHYDKYNYAITYDMYDHDSRNNKNVFLQTLKELNMINNKHIPNIYKINSRENRLKLLAGIIDTDGHYSKKDKGFDIIQKNEVLLNDIIFLVRSLGYSAYKSECKKGCMYKGNKVEGTYYRIFISGSNLSEIPTKCPRKQAEIRLQNKDPLKTGFVVKSIGRGNYYGFELDQNHRYVLGDFTVTHNTSLVKEGISKILNRPFAFIALGGATDSSFLEGHGYTYEGSTWGKIVQILIDSKCMNPVIYFDELDKISETPRGEEIAGILTHLTDTSQNSQFHDKYFADINFDLSKCLFIFSYNDEHKVNPILKDRMYRIKTKGYNQKEKTVITNDYLLPRIREQVKFKTEDIIIPESTIHYIVETHCDKEDGVRNLKRCLEIIHTKLNLYRLMRPGSNLFEGDMALKVEFPFTVTKDLVDKLIKKEKDSYSAISSMYV